MNQGPFFMPNMAFNSTRMMPYGRSFLGSTSLFSRLGNSLKAFNWSSLINGANKTLNVFNQTIPLIRQAKPMIDNVRSITRLAKAFNKETITPQTHQRNINYKNNIIKNNTNYSNTPTFFI